VAEVVEESITETLAFMGAGDEASDIEELDRNGASARDAGTVIRFAAVGEIEAGAGTGNLEVADCALRVDSCETRMRRRSG
jgi:uridine phosphorylase